MTNRDRMWWLGLVVGSVFTVPAEAELLGRLPATPDGTDYQAAYDDVLDITWVTDAALSGILRPWPSVVSWAEGLELGGLMTGGWRPCRYRLACPRGARTVWSIARRQRSWPAGTTSWGICTITTSLLSRARVYLAITNPAPRPWVT